jgi:hypothetical protein
VSLGQRNGSAALIALAAVEEVAALGLGVGHLEVAVVRDDVALEDAAVAGRRVALVHDLLEAGLADAGGQHRLDRQLGSVELAGDP